MKILVSNIGSTSLKYRLFDFSNGESAVLAKGGFERVTDYSTTIEEVLTQLRDGGHIRSADDLAAVGFKTIMAKDVSGCVEATDDVLEAMEFYSSVAPAHNPPYIAGIRQFREIMPGKPMVALFETAFYQHTSVAAQRYAVPQEWYDLGVRRWGFHGASHKYIAERSAELLGREDVAERARSLYVNGGRHPVDGPDLRVVSCHMGGSSSITGIRNGVAIGTSMGMSPQSGLPQNNRVGDLDSHALPFIMRKTGMSADEAQEVLCKQSGLQGVSGVSNDLRDIADAAATGNERAQLALELLTHQSRHWIGAFHLDLNGLDALVFTAGIGENRAPLRADICANLENLGIRLDADKNNNTRAVEAVISTDDSPVKVMIIPTNEELVVAREVKRFLDNR
ncbi:MAG: acetate/propionate family kinase [Verrucomicrobiae bacterium]|nr:acetate/propionate family kinase [Verrucomicrobiae bacterium]